MAWIASANPVDPVPVLPDTAAGRRGRFDHPGSFFCYVREVATLDVYLFGGFQLQSKGATLTPIASRTGRLLLAYLLTHRERAQTRDLLIGRLWPDTDETKARRRLSQALWHIQNVLGPIAGPEPVLVATPSTIRFNPRSDTWIDVAEFEERLLAASAATTQSAELEHLRRVVELYRGDFMAGFYDEWIYQYQGPLREDYVGALDRLARMCKSMGAYEEALGYAHQMVVQNPLHEPAHREVMRLSYLLGRHNEALFQYERLTTLLLDEMDAGPDPESAALQEEILAAREKGDRPFTPIPATPLFEPGQAVELVGRAPERATMIQRLEQTLAGEGGVVMVEGESGVGKTNLLRQAADDAGWRGVGVLWGECDAGMRRPYEAVRNALTRALTPFRVSQLAETVEEVWLAEASRVLPRLAELLPAMERPPPLKPEEEPDRMRQALIRVFQALATPTPQAYFIDDLQWADAETLDFLVRLAEVARASGILVCVSFRSDEARERAESWDTLRRLDLLPGAERLGLVPLDAIETAELARRATNRAVADEFAEGLYFETGGNPLFVLETLRAMHEQDTLDELSDNRYGLPAAGPDLPLAPGVSRVISKRIDGAGPGVRAVLEAAAVFSADADPPALVAISGKTRAEVLTALDETLRRRLLSEVDGGFRFSHEQIQRVVYNGIDGERRVAMHCRAGEWVEEHLPGRVEDLAHHFFAAHVPKKAVRYSREAAVQAVDVYAFASAAVHYSRAIELAGLADLAADERYALLAAYEQVLDVLGRRDEQQATIDAMAAVAGEAGERMAEVLRRRAWLLANTSQFDQAEKFALEALDAAREAERCDALVALGMTLTLAGRHREAVPHLEAAVDAAGGATQGSAATHALGVALSDLPDYERAHEMLLRALDGYERSGDRRRRAEVLNVLGIMATELASLSLAVRYHIEGADEARAIGYARGVAVNTANLANVRRYAGELNEALRLYDEAAVAFAAIGDRRGEGLLRGNRASLNHTFLGDDASALADAETALTLFRESGHGWGEALCYDQLGAIALRQRRFEDAGRFLRRGREAAAASEHQWLEVNLLRNLVLFEIENEQPDAALELVRTARAICAALELDDVEVFVTALNGYALLKAGQVAEALEELRDAAGRLHTGVDQVYRVRYWHFLAASAAGELAEAESAIRLAHAELQEMLSGLSPEQQDRSLSAVPEHRAIVSALATVEPVIRTMRLPGASVPTGRPLRDEDYVEVAWSVAHPDDYDVDEGPLRRRARLLRLLAEAKRQGARPTVEHLADAAGASVATVRRDLDRLRAEGHEARTRGSRTRRGE